MILSETNIFITRKKIIMNYDQFETKSSNDIIEQQKKENAELQEKEINKKTFKKINDLIDSIKSEFFYFIDNDGERQEPYQYCEDLRDLINKILIKENE